MGIMPFNSPVTLLKTHQPLIRHLEASLGRAVVVNTSSDYTTFVNQLLDGQFDIAIAGPQCARTRRFAHQTISAVPASASPAPCRCPPSAA
jgi:ABC-type phosphate/phosphonate transport system substrate-binding protein